MPIQNSQYDVVICGLDGQNRSIASAILSASNDRNVDQLIESVAEEIGNDSGAMSAFAEALDQCEVRDGNVVQAEALFDTGTMIVTRKAA